jgi:hypothetical protein
VTIRSRDIRRVAAVVLGAILAATLATLLTNLPRAGAAPGSAPGTWGAGQYAYVDGKVCTSTRGSAQLTTPLTSWDLGAGRDPAFLTTAITSDGTVDSAAPPLPSVGTQSVSPVNAGSTGFASDGEIATYAALIGMFGSSGPARTAQVADAIIGKVSGSAPGCVDTTAETALLQQAAELAGPYTLTFADQPHSLLPGKAAPVSVTLTSAAGHPVPGATVTFASRDAQLAATTATTNGAGVAAVQARVPFGTHARNLAIIAQAALPISLDEINAAASPTSTDPTGSVAPAIIAAPPTTVTGRTNVRLNLSAHPVVQMSLPDQALDLGAGTDPRATITGMYGHKATVVFTIRGPVPISTKSFCADRTAHDFGATVAATSTLTITGDSTATAGRWQPTRPGCYWVTTRLSTLDAVPKVTVHASVHGALTVLDTSAELEAAHALVKSGAPVTGRAMLRNGDGLAGRVHVALRGPVQPPSGASTCAAADFSSAPIAGTGSGVLGRDLRAGAAGFSIHAGGTGCYQLSGAALVQLPKGITVRVPVPPATYPVLLAVNPSVSYAMNRIWSFPRGQVSARVTVIGTFNQPVHVALQMKRVPAADRLCRGASYSAATSAPVGPAVAARANLDTVAVRSAPLAEIGCYEPVPVLTMDGNHAITATGSFDALTSAVTVGADPGVQQSIGGRASPPGQPDMRRELGALAAFLLLCLVAIVYAIRTARRTARQALHEPNDRLLI